MSLSCKILIRIAWNNMRHNPSRLKLNLPTRHLPTTSQRILSVLSVLSSIFVHNKASHALLYTLCIRCLWPTLIPIWLCLRPKYPTILSCEFPLSSGNLTCVIWITNWKPYHRKNIYFHKHPLPPLLPYFFTKRSYTWPNRNNATLLPLVTVSSLWNP